MDHPRRHDKSADETSNKDHSFNPLKPETLDKLQGACRRMEPFTVRLERLGTFGGAKRGVLWM